MISIPLDQLQKSIQNPALDPEEQRLLLKAAPELGPNVGLYLFRKATAYDFDIYAHSVFRAVFDSFIALRALKDGDLEFVAGFLQTSRKKTYYENGKQILPLALDLSYLIFTRKFSPSHEFLEVLYDFESAFFQFLPSEEIERIVQYNLLAYARRLDLLYEFKKLALVSSGDPEWGAAYNTHLQNNSEVLGQKEITVSGKRVSPTIKNWLLDYVAEVPKALDQRGAYDQVQYMRVSQNVVLLTINERAILLEILKLYQWFMQPVVTEHEIETYEEERAKQLRAAAEVAATAPPPIVPTVNNLEVLATGNRGQNVAAGLDLGGLRNVNIPPTRQVARAEAPQSAIDRKLEELRKKVQ